MRRQDGGGGIGIWLLAAIAVLLGPYLGPALAATFPLEPSAARSSSHGGGQAAPLPAGLTFTNAHGCRPARDWRSARLDGRVRALLRAAARRHQIRVSCLHTGHTKHVRGTSRVSNHFVWRAVDIDRVDGHPVRASNRAARRLAVAIGRGELGAQLSEVGSPWSFGRRPWFSDGGHQGHLHIGFRSR